jgi:hypothetical protein
MDRRQVLPAGCVWATTRIVFPQQLALFAHNNSHCLLATTRIVCSQAQKLSKSQQDALGSSRHILFGALVTAP